MPRIDFFNFWFDLDGHDAAFVIAAYIDDNGPVCEIKIHDNSNDLRYRRKIDKPPSSFDDAVSLARQLLIDTRCEIEEMGDVKRKEFLVDVKAKSDEWLKKQQEGE